MHLSKDYQSNLFCLNNLEYICNKDLELQTIQPSISARLRQVSKIYDKFDINGESQLKEKYSSSSQFNKNHSLYVKYMEPIKAYYINKRNFQEKL